MNVIEMIEKEQMRSYIPGFKNRRHCKSLRENY